MDVGTARFDFSNVSVRKRTQGHFPRYWWDNPKSLDIKKERVMRALGLRGWAMWNAQRLCAPRCLVAPCLTLSRFSIDYTDLKLVQQFYTA
jgi:hypothetical protein